MDPFVWLGPEPLASVEATPPDVETGATVRFLGLVRGSFEGRPVLRLRYEAYPEMAAAELRAIGREAAERFGVRGVRLLHRLGEVGVGEASLRVDVSATHRAEAFAACGWIVDQIKARVPIWKKELLADGEEWV
jgi:molybdopterin synthase catalytic subunit